MRVPNQKNGKLTQNLHGTIFERKSIGSKQRKKKSYKRRAHDVKNQDASEGPRQGPIQGFNLLQMRSKLICLEFEFWTPSKVSLSILAEVTSKRTVEPDNPSVSKW